MTDEHDSRDDEHSPDGLLGAIRLVVDSLVDAERDGRKSFGDSGRLSRGPFRTEYGFSGSIGGPGRGSDDRSSSRRRRSPDDDQYHVDVRQHDDQLLVVADMPDVDAEDVSTGIDEERSELVVGVGNEPIERMELPWPVGGVDARFHHGVLELRFTRADDQGADDEQ